MTDQKSKPKFQIGEWVEKYRFYIGGGLLFLILAGVGFQLYRENYGNESIDSRIKSQEERIKILEEKISKLQISSSNNQTASGDSSALPQNDSGAVASASATQTTSTKSKSTGKVNINTADSSGLESLAGIGPVTAKNILDYRAQNGPFKSINELDNVKGIGQKTIDKFRDQITI